MSAAASDTFVSRASLAADARSLLAEYVPADSEQQVLRDAFLVALSIGPEAMWREGPPDHFTASTFVFDADLERVCLVLHKKAGLWLQPGGHFESVDGSVASAALREATEETGLPGLIVGAELVDLSHHELNSKFGRCRSHLDLRFACIAPSSVAPQVSKESDDVRWWPVEKLPDETDNALRITIPAVRHQLRDSNDR